MPAKGNRIKKKAGETRMPGPGVCIRKGRGGIEWRLGWGIRERALHIEGGQGQTEARTCVTGDMLRTDLL